MKLTPIPRNVPTLALAAILGFQLFVPPSIGLANNNDFPKVIGIFSLGAPVKDVFEYADLKYQFDARYHYQSGFYSSEALLAGAAIGLNNMFSKDGSFDLRWMGLVHGLLFLLAVYLLQSLVADLVRWRFFLWTAIIAFFGDVMYVSYFNSFYMDAAAYVFLMLSVVLFLRCVAWRRKSDAACLVICVTLMLLAKTQHAILGLWIAPLFGFFGGSLWPSNRRFFAIVSTAIVLAATILSIEASPSSYAARGYYSVIFWQVLPHSTNVKADLEALGLDQSYAKFIGTHAYSAESGFRDPEFAGVFMGRTSYSRLGWYFLNHPRDAYIALRTSLEEGGRQRPTLGNFDRSSGLPAFTESQAFAYWSNAKRMLFDGRGVRYLNCFLTMTLLTCAMATGGRKTLPGVLVAGIYSLAGMGLTEMLVASLADAIDVTRHYFIAAAILDVELLIVLWMLVSRMPSGLNHRFDPKSP